MKYLLLLTSMIIINSNSEVENECINDMFLKTDKELIGKYEKIDYKNEFGIRQTVDSINYSIIRRWKDDMTPIIESITNKSKSIGFWKEYHENGKIKEFGFMTSVKNTKIGKWKYFSDSGKLDSIVNYDSKYKLPFCEFYKIAIDRNLTGKTSSIEFNEQKRKWIIEKWTYAKDSPTANGIELDVDSMKITEFKLTGEY
ncbi:hypothetical protein [Flavobacterium sp. 3HN19-14]|uniref:hypothetical protein n=1 Tax=Flavobacterium sp. 3HN19-14 TaxID=3448133 RepID=UPI003EE3B45F